MDSTTCGWIEVELKTPNPIRQGIIAKVYTTWSEGEKWNVEGWIDNQWKSICEGQLSDIKYRIEPVTCRVRLTITDARACPTISAFELYLSPNQKEN